MRKNSKLIFFGSSDFAVPCFRTLIKEKYDITAVVTQPDKPAGRRGAMSPTAIKVEAIKAGKKVLNSLDVDHFKKMKAEAGVVASFGRLIPSKIIKIFPAGCLNLHPSLLPKYRGPSPIQTAILNGDKVTGVTIIQLDEKMDHGPIVAQEEVIINDRTAEELSIALAVRGANLLTKVLPSYLTGNLKLKPQDESQATLTALLKKEDGHIDCHKSAKAIERQMRAYWPWPGNFIEITAQSGKSVTLKLIIAKAVVFSSSLMPGSIFTQNNQLYLQCYRSCLLIKQIQPAGKKIMPDNEFINGYSHYLTRL